MKLCMHPDHPEPVRYPKNAPMCHSPGDEPYPDDDHSLGEHAGDPDPDCKACRDEEDE